LFAPNPGVSASLWTYSESRGGVCYSGSSNWLSLVKATKVELDVVFPVHAEFR
jgi:hypothetical protein